MSVRCDGEREGVDREWVSARYNGKVDRVECKV